MGPTNTSGYRLFLLSILSIALSACGGGGGSDSGSNSAPDGGASSSLALFAGDMRGNGSTDGVGAAARFNSPQGVATDSAGNVYVADSFNNIIRKITPTGVVAMLAGSGQPGSTDAIGAAARFNFPIGVATDGAGNFYVGDTANFTIRKITAAGVVTTLAGAAPGDNGGGGGTADGTGAAASFRSPRGVATDSAGNVYVADLGASTIRKITPAGVVTTLAGTAGVNGSADATGAAASFNSPTGVATDSADNVYVADTFNHTIRKITPAGVVTTLAGTADVPGSTDATGAAASFRSPLGVATDSVGNVFVADTGNNTIRKITPAGAVSTIVGVAGQADFAPGALPGLLESPRGVAVSGTLLYIALLNGVAVVQNLP